MGFPAFIEAIDRLGSTSKARADALGLSERAYYKIKRGIFPDYLRRLARRPELIEALLDDARSGQTGCGDTHPTPN